LGSNPPLPDWFHGTLQHHIDSFSPLKGSFYGKAGVRPSETIRLNR